MNINKDLLFIDCERIIFIILLSKSIKIHRHSGSTYCYHLKNEEIAATYPQSLPHHTYPAGFCKHLGADHLPVAAGGKIHVRVPERRFLET